jgi:hypothetical protein
MAQDQEREQMLKEELGLAIEEATAGIVGEMAEWNAKHQQATFDELEQQVLKARKRFGEQLMQAVLKKRAEVRVVPGPACPKCGAEMRYKGQKERQVTSSIGATPVKRGHYYCSECQRSIFPPG